MLRMTTMVPALALLVSVTALADNRCDVAARTPGDVITLGAVPPPGYPENLACNRDTCYFTSPAAFDSFGDGVIFEFDRRTVAAFGGIRAAFFVPPEIPQAPNALSGIVIDGSTLLVTQNNGPIARIVRIDTLTGAVEPYSMPFPDLPPCVSGGTLPCSPSLPCEDFAPFGIPCSPVSGRAPLLNSAALAPDGSLYVSDSFQATIWKLPRGGGMPQIWYQDPDFEALLGPNGLAIRGGRLYVAVTGIVPPVSAIYTLPLGKAPDRTKRRTFTFFGAAVAPDEMDFGPGGTLYVTGVLSNAVHEFSKHGTPLRVFTHPDFQQPAGVRYERLRCSLIVLNHAILTPPGYQNFAVFDLFVGKREDDDDD